MSLAPSPSARPDSTTRLSQEPCAAQMVRVIVLLVGLACSASALRCGVPAFQSQSALSSSSSLAVQRAPLSELVMAVPKKRQSKMKTRQRKANVRDALPFESLTSWWGAVHL